ncbi:MULTISPECIES: Gfo/Idh/MocA family protein [Paenibacillus]|jgi:predicted dehydrogenase|uniref:Gfo/Idh/MocA family oxidoreductase n=1 Tax=Paenibacillus oceani TaxID=2772510 RepID=A0A927C6M4_9BACL|nr:Gfo/Idh/MocA family oxidoreductase [Paenibacillus oceani]MBD2860937.1 Gfo/Idh/MocA family oxidoreductase [Paenibacillus oceani]MDF2657929.1 oxidoreductase [Paenibacillus sp.]
MNRVRIGIVGIGNMGTAHARYVSGGEINGAELAAVCDISADRLRWAKEQFGEALHTFESVDAMLDSGTVDAILICNLHFDHPSTAMKAFARGIHVLCEKPAGVYTKQVREMNEAAAASGVKFAMMFNQRTIPLYKKLKDLIDSGELGEIRRTNWIITNWYRSQSYYDSGKWRATWAGEGGGVLLNQCPHQLDLWQWTVGMLPSRVRAFCSFGKYRDIEVEDEVTAYVEYPNGATGVFITTTAEAPGTNRLEVTGERGKIVIEDGKLTFWRLRVSEPEFNQTFKGAFGQPECWKCDVPVSTDSKAHKAITQNWVDSIRTGVNLIAPGEEGIRGLTLSNAMYLSAWTDGWVELPLDEDRFHELLQERIATSRYQSNT